VARKIAYWTSTGLVSLLYIASATMYLTMGDQVRQALVGLGYPAYLREVLLAVKILGVVAILSRVSVRLSDLAYAGMFYHLLLACSAHIDAGDGGFIPALLGLMALIVSFLTQNAARAERSPYPPVPA
jgi:hypothetical protein